ncbi:MAG: group II intron reverse transcriptase/maturase, partial [Bacteroidetes bacterium]
MEQILSGENLRLAHQAVRRNKGAPGVDGIRVDDIAAHLRKHWPTIRSKLYDGSYQPALIKGVKIPKPSGGERLLGIPTVQDRIIQQAVQQQLSVLFEPTFSDHSYGFRQGRSAHDAIRAAQSYVQAGKDWVIDIDISAFFDHVNHDILMHRISRQVRDKRVLKLIGRYLRAGLLLDGEVHKRLQGTPQGGPLSPLLANIYLDPLDKELERRGLSFSRYADDLNIYVSSER